MIAIDQISTIGQMMDMAMPKTKIRKSSAKGSHGRVMGNLSQRYHYLHMGQCRKLGFQKRAAGGNFGRQRLVLRRQAFDAIDDDDSVQRQSVINPGGISPPAQPELGQRGKQQIAGIIPGEWPPRPVRPMLARGQPDNRQPRPGIAKNGHRRIPPIWEFDATFLSKRGQSRAALAIIRRFGTGQRAGNLHVLAIGAGG